MTKIVTKKYKNFEINIIPKVVNPALGINYIFLIRCLKTNVTICVDPGEFNVVDDFLKERGLKLDFIIITHRHLDHVSGIIPLKEEYDCKVVIFEEDRYITAGGDVFIRLDEKVEFKIGNTSNVSHETLDAKSDNMISGNFKLGEIEFCVFTTFGHCANHISYFIKGENILFCGDTLFSSGCGRVFADGSLEELYESLNKIRNLPTDTQIYCAHEYTLDNIDFALTIEPDNKDLLQKQEMSQKLRNGNMPTIPTIVENEIKTNPFLRFDNEVLKASLDMKDKNGLEVFKAVRAMKDRF